MFGSARDETNLTHFLVPAIILSFRIFGQAHDRPNHHTADTFLKRASRSFLVWNKTETQEELSALPFYLASPAEFTTTNNAGSYLVRLSPPAIPNTGIVAFSRQKTHCSRSSLLFLPGASSIKGRLVLCVYRVFPA